MNINDWDLDSQKQEAACNMADADLKKWGITPLKPSKSNLERLAEKVRSTVLDELILEQVYYGQVKEVYLNCKFSYKKIVILYEIEVADEKKYVKDEFTFGGDYDEWYMTKLFTYLKNIKGMNMKDIDFTDYGPLEDSLQFLVGASVSIFQTEGKNGKRNNNVEILGTYDATNKKIIPDSREEQICNL